MLLVHFPKILETTTIVDAATLHFSKDDNFEGWWKGWENAEGCLFMITLFECFGPWV